MQDRALTLGDKVVYQIYIRSFYDANNDGIGDLAGITAKLDYLKELGVDYLWITPFFVSPQNDNGYDVAHYTCIDPLFGTMEDFEELSSEAKKRGIGLMLDMVFNHTSTEHEWFKKALAGDEKYLNYYKFVDASGTRENPGPAPTNWQSKFGGSAWEYVPSLHKWYLHLFDVSQADLNWDNPEVRKELVEVIKFWKDKGVSGFRFDVVNLISKPDHFKDDFEGDGRRFYTDGPHVHEYLQELVKESGIADMITVGEMSSTSIDNCIRYSAPEHQELSQVFSFHHLKVDYDNGDKWALKAPDITELRKLFKDWQEEMAAAGGWNALFWSNHDQPRPNSRFANCDTKENWLKSSKLLAMCTHLMRGTPYIYQGEELGMVNPNFNSIDDYRDVESKNYFEILQAQGKSEAEALHIIAERSRDGSRTPVQWDDSLYAGFSEVEPWISVQENKSYLNAKAELDDPESMFFFYKKLIKLRKDNLIVQRGSVSFIDGLPEKVIAYERTYEGKKLLVFCNFGGAEVDILYPELDGASTLLSNSEENRFGAGLVRLSAWGALALEL